MRNLLDNRLLCSPGLVTSGIGEWMCDEISDNYIYFGITNCIEVYYGLLFRSLRMSWKPGGWWVVREMYMINFQVFTPLLNCLNLFVFKFKVVVNRGGVDCRRSMESLLEVIRPACAENLDGS